MLATNYSNIRENLKEYCDKVTDDNETIIITRKNDKNIVMISLNEYNKMIKFIRNSQYIAKLEESFDQLEKGKVVHKIIEELESLENE